MKVSVASLSVVCFAALAFAAAPQKPVIVSYPADTPRSVVEQAMEAVKKAGGIITHEYSIIKGFAAKVSEQTLETVQSMGHQHNVVVEQDTLVSVDGH